MKKISLICLLPGFILMYSCTSGTQYKPKKITADLPMLDSIKNKADSIYSKKYPGNDLSIAEYFINRNDSTMTQVMKDSAGMIRQIIIARNNTRIYTASFITMVN